MRNSLLCQLFNPVWSTFRAYFLHKNIHQLEEIFENIIDPLEVIAA
jgi:hypothetical protein